ncbi:TolC family protein [Pontibacter silvestris]|uniref:TolC family protein n=1 Tax=Pontibacter silvestris TaxID=2305183 RepID=A0ABW4WXN9_9BACT|nr:TolC family protein [Pontibacter silvestris]MCC9135380.1 TolC family protein [Pontibacter silvestris]
MKKLSKKVLLAIGLSLTGLSGAFAQQDGTGNDQIWSLEEALNYAKANNLQVRQSKINRDLASTDLKLSKFGRLPSINGSGSYSINNGTNIDPATYDIRTQQTRSSSVSVSGSLPLFAGFQQVNTIKQNSLELQASEQDILSVQNDITIQIVTAYLNILFADELMKTNQLQRNTTQQQLERTQILFRAGSVAENDVLDLQSQLATDELNIITAKNQLDIAKLNLIQLLNLDNPDNIEVEIPELPEPDLEPAISDPNQVYDVAIQTLPAIKAADVRVLSANKGLDIARGAYLPRLSLNAGINTFYSSRSYLLRELEDGETIYTQQLVGFLDEARTQPFSLYVPQGSAEQIDYSLKDQFKDNIGNQFSLSLQVPIFNGLQTRINVERAKISQQNAKLNADIARNNLRQTIEQAAVDTRAAQLRYVASKQQLAASEKSYQNAQLRLNAGVINSVDFNIIANTFRSAQSSLLQAKYEYIFKLKILDFYEGKDLSF